MKLALILMALCAVSAVAQPKGTPAAKPAPMPAPRWPDGRVNLGSTAQQKGYWEVRPAGGGQRFPRAADVPMQPWARALSTYRAGAVTLYPPLVGCKPASGPGFFNSPGFEIIDVPDLKRVFLLNIAGAHSWRVIYTDGRQHPAKLRPTYLGHSIGHWEGDTLVVDTVGFNEKQWLFSTYPTTEQLHLTERFSRPNLTTLNYDVTVNDPGAYTATWSGGWTNTTWLTDGEMFEYICQNARETK